MSNQQLFTSYRGTQVPRANALNEAGGRAYQRTPEAALALYAVTGCFNDTFYSDASTQLATTVKLCEAVEPAFVAQVAIYARKHASMKDMPAMLLAYLAVADGDLLARAFDHVVDNGRMLRNFVQIIRSGVLGRKSLGSRPKRLVREWIGRASAESLMAAAVGASPSLADIIRMVHPAPANPEREALYAWLIGKPADVARLPGLVREYVAFKSDPTGPVPDVPFQYLTSLPLTGEQWGTIAERSSWQTTRMNLNTFLRQGAFSVPGVVEKVAAKLRDPEAIRRARVFPYQLLVAYRAAAGTMPIEITEALQDAMEIATAAVPVMEGSVAMGVDVSLSMADPVTGRREGATTVATCVEVAALITATFLRANPQTLVLPFADRMVGIRVNPRDSVITQSLQIAQHVGGGTNLALPLQALNKAKYAPNTVIIVSDNQSWMQSHGHGGTETMRQWATLKASNPKARLILIDIQPIRTSQAMEQKDVTHIGGFSDAVFSLIADVAAGDREMHWMERIQAIEV